MVLLKEDLLEGSIDIDSEKVKVGMRRRLSAPRSSYGNTVNIVKKPKKMLAFERQKV
jgi:hypothetical protein